MLGMTVEEMRSRLGNEEYQEWYSFLRYEQWQQQHYEEHARHNA